MEKIAALVLFSGGQDSTTCLGWALHQGWDVETVGFDYRQRHVVELQCRQDILKALKGFYPKSLGDDHMVDMGSLAEISQTALTRDIEIEMTASGLPSTFVPGRNILMLTYAAAIAYRRGITRIVGGMCQTDYSGYPDCRQETIQALEKALTLGMDRTITLDTPLMNLTKAQTWQLAAVGPKWLLPMVIENSHTCYKGDRSCRHPWGYGCGECPACVIRARGYKEFNDTF